MRGEFVGQRLTTPYEEGEVAEIVVLDLETRAAP
jgi:hypothetical protein